MNDVEVTGSAGELVPKSVAEVLVDNVAIVGNDADAAFVV